MAAFAHAPPLEKARGGSAAHFRLAGRRSFRNMAASMKRCFCIGAAALLACSARADLVSAVQVVVDDSVITYGEIKDAIGPRLDQLMRVYPDNEQKFNQEAIRVKDEQIENLVERKLILHDFVSSGYTTNVLEAFIDDRIRDKIQKQFYGDRSRLLKTLQAEGMTYEMFRRQEREAFIIDYMSFQNTSQRKILISPLKIENYYNTHQDLFKVEDQVKLRMIVLPQAPDAPAGAAGKLAREILAKVDSGVPFAEMAGVYSGGSQRAEGGDRGWVDRTYFKPELAQVAFSLKAGQHSGVIELPEGCYLMMVEEARPAHVRPLVEVRDDVERTLKAEESLHLREKWIKHLKSKSFVEFY